MTTHLQGTQVQLPSEQVKKLETLRNDLNLDRGVIIQCLMETCFDKVLSEHSERIIKIQHERTLVKIKNRLTPQTKPEPTKPTAILEKPKK